MHAYPANGATGVFINSAIILRFGEPLLTGTPLAPVQSAVTTALSAAATGFEGSLAVASQTLQAYLNRTCCGNSVVPGTVTLAGPDGTVSGTVASSNDALSVTFAPTQPLLANTPYTVQAQGVRDTAGNKMVQAFSAAFATGTSLDTTPPQIALTDPANGATNVPTNVHYTVQFTKIIDPSTLTPATFSIVDTTTNTPVMGMVLMNADDITTSFVPSTPLPLDRTFSVVLTRGIKDADGNSLASQVSFSFTTGSQPETSPPHWLVSSPTNGSSGIPVNAVINLGFSQPLEIPTVAPNIQVTAGGNPIAVLVALSNGDQSVITTPAENLTPNAQYVVSIGPGIADLAGLLLDNPGTFTFQTGAVSAPAPVISSLSLKSALFNTVISHLTVTGANFVGATFAFTSSAIAVSVTSVNAAGTSATLSFNAGTEAGTFALFATNGFVTSTTAVTAADRFTVVDPSSTAIAADGYPVTIDALFGVDPLDPTSVPNASMPPSGEVDAQVLSVLNSAGGAPGEPLAQEADATPFSSLNIAGITGGQPVHVEVDGTVFSVVNADPAAPPGAQTGNVPSGPAVPMEADAVVFSVNNTAVGAPPAARVAAVLPSGVPLASTGLGGRSDTVALLVSRPLLLSGAMLLDIVNRDNYLDSRYPNVVRRKR